MKKILFITSSSINGGAQKHIRNMFRILTNKGCNVYLVAPKGWLTNELIQYQNKLLIMEASLKNVKKLQLIMDEIKPDIVNTFILSGGCFGYFAWLRGKHGKIFITVNNPVRYEGISKVNSIIYPQLYKWMAKHCTAFLVKSDMVKQEVAEIINDKAKTISINNGIDFNIYNRNIDYEDLRKELSIPYDATVVTNVAVLDKRKGHQYYIKAAKKLLQNNRDLYFLIVGDGEERGALTTLIEELGITEKVKLIGERGDINRVLYFSDIFVLSSLHEGLPNALMEAMSMGLPCVATDVGGVRELISDEKLGVVIRPKSSEDIEEALDVLLNNQPLRNDIGTAAYKKMKDNYELNTVADELLNIYETI